MRNSDAKDKRIMVMDHESRSRDDVN
jgi:hypothetical protein